MRVSMCERDIYTIEAKLVEVWSIENTTSRLVEVWSTYTTTAGPADF